MDDLVDVVHGDLLEIGDKSGNVGQAQMVKCKGKSERIQEEKKILTALPVTGGINCEQTSYKTERKSRGGSNHGESNFESAGNE